MFLHSQEDVLCWSRSRSGQNSPDQVQNSIFLWKRDSYLLQRFDAKTMVDNPKVSASTGMVDDGTGVKEVLAPTIPPEYLLDKNIFVGQKYSPQNCKLNLSNYHLPWPCNNYQCNRCSRHSSLKYWGVPRGDVWPCGGSRGETWRLLCWRLLCYPLCIQVMVVVVGVTMMQVTSI